MKALLICIFLGLCVMTANTVRYLLSHACSQQHVNTLLDGRRDFSVALRQMWEQRLPVDLLVGEALWRLCKTHSRAWWHVSQYYISAADETHGPEKTRVTFLTVILFEFTDVFIQEHVRILVVFCLQLEKLFFDQERSRGGGYKKKQKSKLRKRSHHYRNGDSHE